LLVFEAANVALELGAKVVAFEEEGRISQLVLERGFPSKTATTTAAMKRRVSRPADTRLGNISSQ